MIDLCYQDFDAADVAAAFGLKSSDAAAAARLREFVAAAFEAGRINWRLLDDGSVFRRRVARDLFRPEAVIADMIDFVQTGDRIC